MTKLSNSECERYERQLILPEIGVEGQKKLKDSRVLIVGAGGLGAPVGLYLAAAGVGRVGVMDADRVGISNLQRQVWHGTEDVGRYKTKSAKEAMQAITPKVKVREHRAELNAKNVAEILEEYDVGVGCVDNFEARYVLDEECVRQGKAHVFGAVCGFEGQAGVFGGGGMGCYRCFFRDRPQAGWKPEGAEKGILGSVAGVIGCIQANETVKILLGIGNTLHGRLLLFDGLRMRFRELAVKQNPDCPVCGSGQTQTDPGFCFTPS